MTIVTNVPNNFVPPGTFNVFNYLRAGGSLINVPLTVAMIATKSAAGTAVLGTVYEVSDPAISDGLAGVNSEGALMCRQAYDCARLFQRGPRLRVVFIAEPAGGVANVQTLTFVGTATSDGNVVLHVSGRPFVVGIRTGNNATSCATAAANEINGKADTLPVVVTSAAGVVTFTHPTKGVNGKDVFITIDQQVPGVVGTVATTVVGTGAADITPGLTALAPLRYDGIAIANHTTTDITALLLDRDVRWSASSKVWGWYFVGEYGTVGTATSLAAAANERSIIIANMEGCLNAPGEMAVTTAMLVWSRERANSGYDGAIVPLYPPLSSSVFYTAPEVDTAIKAGLTVYTGVIDSSGGVTANRARCAQVVTSKTTLAGGAPDDRNRDIAVSRVGVALAIELDVAAQDALGPERNPDGISQEDSLPLIRDLASAILRSAARATPPIISRRYVEEDVAAIQVEIDLVTPGRNNARLPYHVNTPLHQVAWVHDVIIGG